MYKKIIEKAFEARENAYCPYSGFAVGAALLSKSGEIFSGCNIENSAGTSNCAERTAIFKAVSEGVRDFDVIVIVGAYKKNTVIDDYCYPCGICRQVMSEFCDKDFKIISAKSIDDYEVHTLGEMLPLAFKDRRQK